MTALATGTSGIFALIDPLGAFDHGVRTTRWVHYSDAWLLWLRNTESFDGRKLLVYAEMGKDERWRVWILDEESDRPDVAHLWRGRIAPRGYTHDIIEPMLEQPDIVVLMPADLTQGSTLQAIYLAESPAIAEVWLYALDRGEDYVYYIAATTSEPPAAMADFGFRTGAERLREFFGGL